jgi:hypothetical protein
MGISIREFSRRDGCSDTLVHKALKTGRLHALPDGTLDPALIGTGWRKANRRKAGATAPTAAAPKADPPAPPDLEQLADQVVNVEGRAPYTLIEAERIKANYLALLRQLQYDRESGAVVAVDEVVAQVTAEYAVVRNHFLGFSAKLAPRLCAMRRASVGEFKVAIDAEVYALLEGLTLDSAATARPRRPKGAARRRHSGQDGAAGGGGMR